jgi:hypothetical protein
VKLSIPLALFAVLSVTSPAVAIDKLVAPSNLESLPHADVQAILGRWQYPAGDEPILTFEFRADSLAVKIVKADGKVSNGTADADYRQGEPGVIWLVTRNARSSPPTPVEAPVAVTRLHLVSNNELDMADVGQDFNELQIIPLSRAR